MPSFLFQNAAGGWAVSLDLYYPPFLERLLDAKAAAADRGCWMYSYFGYRSIALQERLYKAYLRGEGGKAAPPGLSAHNYGLADDSAFDKDHTKDGLQPDWNADRYKIYGEELEKVGLVWGESFQDSPHAQWPGFVNGGQLKALLKIWNSCPPNTLESTKLKAVWQYLDTLGGK